MKKTIILFILFFSVTGCYKENFNKTPNGYYTLEQTNYAWGYHKSGWMIDMQGNIMSFNLPSKWNYTDTSGFITENKLIENISNCENKIGEISKNELYRFSFLINKAIEGNMTEKINVGNDAGQYQYSCYKFDANSGLYKKVILSVEGDFRYHNENFEAIEISEWMKKLNNNYIY